MPSRDLTGEDPYGDLLFDKAGNIYGTTAIGGTGGWGCGLFTS